MNSALQPCSSCRAGRTSGFTLTELLVASAIAAVGLGGIIYGYVNSAQVAEWSAHHFAAHSLAMQRLEQTRAAKWDFQPDDPVDELVSSNFPVVVEMLDIPIASTNAVYATNYTTISTVSTQPQLKLIRVDCVWAFRNRGVFTNTVVTYRAPDQ